MKPLYWRIRWQAHPDGTPAGFADYSQRARARGFLMIRRAAGFVCSIKPMWH